MERVNKRLSEQNKLAHAQISDCLHGSFDKAENFIKKQNQRIHQSVKHAESVEIKKPEMELEICRENFMVKCDVLM